MVRMTQKEKQYGITMLAFIAIWLLYSFGIAPAVERISTLNRIIPQKREEMLSIRKASKQYLTLRNSLNKMHTKIAERQSTFQLLPYVESLIIQSDLKKNVQLIKPHVLPLDAGYRECIVELKFASVELNQLVDFLCKVESSEALISIKSLHIKKAVGNPDLLDCTIDIRTAKLANDEGAVDS